jgi:hypothetical protein
MAAVDWKYLLEQFTEQDWLVSTEPHITEELAFVTTEDPPSKRKMLREAELKGAFLKAPESLLRLGGWDVYRVAEAAGAAGDTRSVWALVAARDVSAPNGGMPKAELPLQMRRSYCPDQQDSVERAAQAALLRDVYGNPFRPVSSLPAYILAWNDRTVPRISEGIYEERAFDRLPVLHDALLDAGCEDEALLAHCRSEGPHVRGCWAVDLMLGKH